MIKVNEIYTALQGEGATLGKPCTFLRLAMCNLHCKWCDTPYAWNFGEGDGEEKHGTKTVKMSEEMHIMEIKDVARQIMEFNKPRLVITGGEPLLQQGAICELIEFMRGEGFYTMVEVETNGTIPMMGDSLRLIDQINCSPKLANSGNEFNARYKPHVLSQLNNRRAIFKFVVSDGLDIQEIERMVDELKLNNIILMAEGRTKEEQEKLQTKVAELALDKNWSFSPRLHILMYGKKRGI